MLLAHATVVYAMRRREDQKLNAQQLFALADKGWSDVPLLWNAKSKGQSSWFLWLAALLILLGAILQPLMSALISFVAITVPTALDEPLKQSTTAKIVGYDPEPADIPLLSRDLILRDVLGRLSTVSDLEPQQNLWPSNSSSEYLVGKPLLGQSFYIYAPGSPVTDVDSFFVTAVNSGTTTGVLREHALRLSSAIECKKVAKSDFPSPCPGPKPFETHVTRQDLELSVCVPGDSSQFPFTASRNRQDIVEDLFIDLSVSFNLSYLSSAPNFTLHCTASTSRGYFELPNEQNKYVAGPLLDEWPSPEYILKNTNDYRGADGQFARPTVEDSTISSLNGALPQGGGRSAGQPFNGIDGVHASIPGPLMVSAEVIFGNYSFVQFLANNITEMSPLQAYASVCEHGNIPFSQVGYLSTSAGPTSLDYCYNAAGDVYSSLNGGSYASPQALNTDLTTILAAHTATFSNTDIAEYALKISTYLANRALLINTASNEQPFGPRPIYYSPGLAFPQLIVNKPSVIIITILIASQLVGLLLLTRFIYSVPAWTSTLNALEVAQIGKALPIDDWPPLGEVTATETKRLIDIDALIGIEKGQGERGGERDEGTAYESEEGGQSAEGNAEVGHDASDSRIVCYC
ncbi:hypothetical protein ONZ43_g4328 [Nemania bipapillata]|uniref:Uncharacterized protein n=1 Tax=Nemania bipapillata TaxID=110536 RepID=A0ACC2IPC3_9PEZI|nr:hypothetical protein ONZ43_g4328 [Nemania bipapillata]